MSLVSLFCKQILESCKKTQPPILAPAQFSEREFGLSTRQWQDLIGIGCVSGKGIGKVAHLSEDGYRQVVETCCQYEMEVFIYKAVDHLGMKVCHKAGPTALAPYYSCQEGPQSYEALTNEILNSTVSAHKHCAWAEKLGVDCPEPEYYDVEKCSVGPEAEEDELVVSSHRRRSCGGVSGGPITTGFVEFTVSLALPDPAAWVNSGDAKDVVKKTIAAALGIPEARVVAVAHEASFDVNNDVSDLAAGVQVNFAVVDPYGQLDGQTLAEALENLDMEALKQQLMDNGAPDPVDWVRFRVYEPDDSDAPTYHCTPYVPGQPGGAWTPKEIQIVKSKIKQVIDPEMRPDALQEMTSLKDTSWTDEISAPKLLRLLFHDCMLYTDGSGGCDGCIYWGEIGERFTEQSKTQFSLPRFNRGNNSGLGPTVEVMEEIYTNPDFPTKAPKLEQSLQNCGKSRADLWALAGIVAIEQGIVDQNLGCQYPDEPRMKVLQQCVRNAKEDSCFVDYSNPAVFKTGRADCVTSEPKAFMSAKREEQPNPHDNGKDIVQWMKTNFGVNGKETVALMGAHTFGRKHRSHSMFPYPWTNRNNMFFNNEYFRNMALKPEWFYDPDDSECMPVGNYFNKKPEARWVAHAFRDTVDGGPAQWIQEKLVCYNDCNVNSTAECCGDLPSGATCCQDWQFANGNDESMLNTDIGLFYDFQVREDGLPTGCDNLGENFTLEMFKKEYKYTWSGNSSVPTYKAETLCPLNTFAEPAGSDPLHKIVEDFADNQQYWIDSFIPAFEKMLANGYQAGDLRTN